MNMRMLLLTVLVAITLTVPASFAATITGTLTFPSDVWSNPPYPQYYGEPVGPYDMIFTTGGNQSIIPLWCITYQTSQQNTFNVELNPTDIPAGTNYAHAAWIIKTYYTDTTPYTRALVTWGLWASDPVYGEAALTHLAGYQGGIYNPFYISVKNIHEDTTGVYDYYDVYVDRSAGRVNQDTLNIKPPVDDNDVPEPATLLLVGAGLFCLGLTPLRRRK